MRFKCTVNMCVLFEQSVLSQSEKGEVQVYSQHVCIV